MAKVLLVDDQPGILDAYTSDLNRQGHQTMVAMSAQGALEALRLNSDFDVVVLDMRIPEADGGKAHESIGFNALKRIRSDFTPPVIILSHMGGDAYRNDAIAGGAYDFVSKNEDLSTLFARVRNAAAEGLKSLEYACLRIGMFPGQSEIFQSFIKRVKAAAKWKENVLITGESGSGKELTAHLLHFLSDRAKLPMLSVNASTITSSLAESELFGHEKGAFNEAKERHKGYFEITDGACLFIDEIGDLPISLQPKLLRVLERGSFLRVGGNREVETDVRVLSATNRDLGEMVMRGEYRQDLCNRLQRIKIATPALNERPEDIFPLTRHLVERFNWNVPPENRKHLHDNCQELLINQDWRDRNVRGLKDVVTELFLTIEHREIHKEELNQCLASNASRVWGEFLGKKDDLNKEVFLNSDGSLKTFNEIKEDLLICKSLRNYLDHAFRKAGGRWDEAAKLAEISEDTLRKYRRLLAEKGLSTDGNG